MTRRGAAAARSASEYLDLALRARSAATRERYAAAGLAIDSAESDPDVTWGLHRQLHLARMARGDLDAALDALEGVVAPPDMRDIAHHDRARLLAAAGRIADAVRAQRLAARAAPPSRRSVQCFVLGSLLHRAGETDRALHALGRAELWAIADRPLVRAQAALVQLESGRPAPGLAGVVSALASSKYRDGYGRFVLGMLAARMGDPKRAEVHLQAFLRRHASAPPERVIGLAYELQRAREILARGTSN